MFFPPAPLFRNDATAHPL